VNHRLKNLSWNLYSSHLLLRNYSAHLARIFYKYVMGGGGMDIHYGVFTKSTDTVYESSKETNHRLITSLHWTRPITKDSVVLDLGSGHGGISQEIAVKYGCTVIGVNISPEQNKMNLAEAETLGVGELVSVELMNFNDGLPDAWQEKFTHVISCEVLCHAASKPNLFKDLKKVMKPGAGFAFTDIMGAEGADEKVLKDFTDRNATTKMARPSEYLTMLKEVEDGQPLFLNGSFLDYSQHLVCYFQGMVDQVNKHSADMLSEGVAESYLAKWMESLTSRVDIQKEHKVFAWGIFVCRKDGPLF
jgi:sarcosine/dimethylglycine N-methyltransferase